MRLDNICVPVAAIDAPLIEHAFRCPLGTDVATDVVHDAAGARADVAARAG